MLFVLLLVLLAQAGSQPAAPTDVTRLAVSQPRAVCEIDSGKLKGTPSRLAWSNDGTFYLRVVEVDRWLNERSRHYLIAGAAQPVATDGEPAWASTYWGWKSDMMSPRDPSFRVEVESRTVAVRTTNPVKGGDIAGMGGVSPTGTGQGMPQQAGRDAAMSSQPATVMTLRVKGQIIGEWTNERPQPGTRFGWAPAPVGALAFADTRDRLVLMDRDGRRREVAGTSSVLLPGWSPDGKQIAYLQKKDKKKYVLMIVDVGTSKE